MLDSSLSNTLLLTRGGTRKMEQVINSPASVAFARRETAASRPAYQAYQILRLAFTVAPIVAGLDKFFNLLVNWEQYLPKIASRMVGGHGHELMLAVGVIEIIAGIGVAVLPKVFAYVVAAWLLLIVTNLLMIPGYFDVALRDFGLSLGALALARLSSALDTSKGNH
jgi:uncharacterized membrane protein YphA (DoxX/SURF4 family)